jgi:hypothetical protein
MMMTDPTSANGNLNAAGGYGPPGGGYPPGGGGGYGGPPPGGGGYGGPPPGGGGPPGYGGPPGGAPPGGYGGPPGGAPPGGGYGGPPPGGFGGPPGFGPPGGGFQPGGPMMPGAGGDVNTTLPLILSICQLVLCCNLVFGGIGLVFAIQAGNAKKTGDIEGARAKAKTAMIVIIVGAVLETIGVGLNILVSAMH